MGFENVGRVWTPAELKTYLGTLTKPDWATSITFHHTGVPSLEQRPNGFLPNHLTNLQSYYQVTNKWSAGPHLFIDEDQCWGMSDFRQYGVHAKSFNTNSIGIEVLGNYDVESPTSGRGQQCWAVAAGAGKVLLDWLGLQPSALTVKFHRDDPKTDKTCPGTLVEKTWVINQIHAVAAVEAFTTAVASVAGLLGFRY